VVLDGLIKVYQTHEDKELLLYYIQHAESCIMSFASALNSEPSKVYAITEEPTTALLFPVNKVQEWVEKYKSFNTLFFSLYNKRYDELLETINQIIFKNLDARLLDYLKEKAVLKKNNFLDIRHKQIANELGTSREVISRLIKKLEGKEVLKQLPNGIEIFESL